MFLIKWENKMLHKLSLIFVIVFLSLSLSIADPLHDIFFHPCSVNTYGDDKNYWIVDKDFLKEFFSNNQKFYLIMESYTDKYTIVFSLILVRI